MIETANKEKVVMIVIGSRGAGKLRRTILGSISDYVLHNASCAVTFAEKKTKLRACFKGYDPGHCFFNLFYVIKYVIFSQLEMFEQRSW